MQRRHFVVTGLAGAALRASGLHVTGRETGSGRSPFEDQGTELQEATLAQLQEWMTAGRVSSRGLVEEYLARIAANDRAGAGLCALIETNPDALATADALDAERRAGHARGPLHGIPVLIKDNIDTGDRMHTSAGSLALESSIAPRDAFIAARLREAGAVLLGKTNMSEWANFRSTHSSSGWSGRGGQCRNPYVLDRTPSGSSSGTGAAIASNFAAAGVGTETDGSVTSPAAACSLVGLKPTVGLVSRAGIIPIAHSQDTAGPMGRCVADIAALLQALAGEDPRDAATRGSARRARADYVQALTPDGLSGLRLGVARKRYTGYNDAVNAMFEDALRLMRDHGAVLVDPADVTTEDHLKDEELQVLLYEFKADLNAYLASLGPQAAVKSLADVIAFNERERARSMPYFAQETMIRAQAKRGLTSPEYRRARATCLRWARTLGIDAVMTRHRLDAIVCPTQAPAWPIDLANGDPAGIGNCTTPAAIAGYPHITVPMGYTLELPIGLSFFGRPWSETVLLKAAFAFEQATHARHAPRFLPT
ncbi:MAG: amidase, partial [Gemmatimonadales bacterium]